jgi:membrane protein DedA with SNARE-associated domain
VTIPGFHPTELLTKYGYAAVFVIIALENLGVPLPGETMLITAAIYAGTTHRMSVVLIVVTAAAAAIAGGMAGFGLGRYGGDHLLHRYGRYLHADEKNLRLGRYLFERYGGRVVFFGRFIAFLRAFAGLLAGINRMDWTRFLLFNALGASAWASAFGFGAYALGRKVEVVSARAGFVITTVVVLVAVAGFWFLRRHHAQLQRAADRAG